MKGTVAMKALLALFAAAAATVAHSRTVSLDLRAPIQNHASPKLRLGSTDGLRDGVQRSFDLNAGVADVGEIATGDELSFTLFDDVTINLTLGEKLPSPLGGDVFLAGTSGCDGVKNAVVMRTDDGLTIDVRDDLSGKVYKVISTPTGVKVQEIEPADDVECGCDRLGLTEDEAETFAEMSEPHHAASYGRLLSAPSPEDGTFVDILVAYDGAARSWANDYGGITNFAIIAVSQMNTALSNTELDKLFRFRLVGVTCVDVSTADLGTALNAALNGTDGWEAIRAARDEVGADIVSVMIDTGSSSGLTGLGRSLRTTEFASFSESAYNACAVRAVAQGSTMTHEVGHNMGAGHSKEQTTEPGPQLYDYSAGYYFTANGYAYSTIMAYGHESPNGGAATATLFFSSPEFTYEGVAVGDAGHDNTRTIRQTYAAISAFRASKVGEITTGEPNTPLEWITSKEDAFAQAQSEGKLVFLLYGTNTCGIALAVKNVSCENQAVKSRLRKDFVCWYCGNYYEAREYLRDTGYPQLAIIDPANPGSEMAYRDGYQDAESLLFMISKTTHENEFSEFCNGYEWRAYVANEKVVLTSVSPAPVGDLAIPEEICGIRITDLDYYLFKDNTKLTSVMIPDSIKAIGEYAFDCCSAITNVTMPGVVNIGFLAFCKCTGLTNVTIPDSVATIGYGAFIRCSNLRSVTIPHSVTNIMSAVFSYCDSLVSIAVDERNVNYKSTDRFLLSKSGDTILQAYNIRGDVAIPEGVTEIASLAFEGCAGLTRVTIGNDVARIGEFAFHYCIGLSSATIMDSVKTITLGAFEGCSGLTRVDLPESISSIPSQMFYGCGSLTDVTIPKSVESIGNHAFNGCKSIKRIELPPLVSGVGTSAFKDCESLECIDLSGPTRKSIGPDAFSGCTNLSSVTIPYSVSSIGEKAFYGCTGLATANLSKKFENENMSLIFPDTTAINFCNFENDLALTISGGVLTAVDLNDNTEVVIPHGVRDIAARAFYNCKGLRVVTIPNSVTNIRSRAFHGCSDLVWAFAPSPLKDAVSSNAAFYECSPDLQVVYYADSPDEFSFATLTFDANGGETPETSKQIVIGCPVGRLPAPTWKMHSFLGWFTDGGSQVDESTVATGDASLYARWEEKQFVTGGDGVWTKQDDGIWQSGPLTPSQSVWIETIVHGSGTLTFDWKVSSNASNNYLYFYVDDMSDYSLDPISGTRDWTSQTYVISEPGEHTLRWKHWKSSKRAYVSGLDCGWIRNVVWTPNAADAPAIDGDDGATVEGDATAGYVVRPSAGNKDVEVTIPDGVDADKVVVEVSTSVETVRANGATVHVMANGSDITEYLDIQSSGGTLFIASATVKADIANEAIDTNKGAEITLNPESPSITTAATKAGLTYTLREGETIETMQDKSSKVGDGNKWTPQITVKGGTSGFYTIKVEK